MAPLPSRRLVLKALAVLAGLGGGCTSAPPPEPVSPRVPGRTEVIVLGTLHGAHRSSQGFSLEVIRDTVRRIRPDVVLTEIPPDRFEAALLELDALGSGVSPEKISDDWVRAFPEIWGVLVPLRRELNYELVPVSGWKPAVSADRRAYYAKHPEGPPSASYRSARAAFQSASASHDFRENPRWVNGPEYLELTTHQENALADAADSQLGMAAVRRINEAHWVNIEAAIAAHGGARILLVYGARHRWYTQPRIEALSGVTLLPVVGFLP